MKTTILTLFYILLTHLSSAQKSEFIGIKKTTGTTNDWFGTINRIHDRRFEPSDSLHVEAFEISPFITWKQYKLFLEDVKRMHGNRAYSEILPKIDSDHLSACLSTTKFDKSAVTGVSWTVAKEYCKWRMIVDNLEIPDTYVYYALPTLLEWLAAYHQLEEEGKKHDFNQTYADWTLNSFDESWQFDLDYRYSALNDDPPAMKRKVVIGGNFAYRFPELKDYKLSFYQDSSYSHIGFRLVRFTEGPNDYSDENDLYLGDHFPDLWVKDGDCGAQHSTRLDSCSILYYYDYGRFSGRYESHYLNGKLKAKGFYYNNQRVGKWEVWDSLGLKRLERNYVSPYRFTQSFPKLKDDQATILRNARMIEFQRNKNGFLDLPHVQERSVLWSQRYWSRIEAENNDQFFKKERLLNALSEGVKNGEITPYGTSSDQFIDTISKEEFAKQNNGVVTSFELKSDIFYDLDRGLMSTRIVGICPIITDTIDGASEERKLAWFYFPHLRALLSNEQCFTNKDYMTHWINKERGPINGTSTKTLDDLFFLRDFEETITGIANFKGRSTLKAAESDRAFLEFIELEHDWWLKLESRNE